MKPSSTCPDESILKALVLGEINEPLLEYYLDHIEHCEHCTEIIDKSSWPQLEFQALITKSRVNLADLKPDDCSVDMAWLESVKKNFPGADFNPAGNPDNALGLPEIIGNYRLTNLLGDGATSIVYQAEDMSLHRQVALKILYPGFEENPDLQESILSEARAIASLSHENILPIYHVEKFGHSPILVFPLLPGSTLQSALQEKQFSLKESLQIIRDLASALDFIHFRGILHRDIKPSNIWLGQREDGRPCAMLFDFGFVGLQQNRSGTSGYMAPEQIGHLPNSPATDMFALGTLLFQLTRGLKLPEKIRKLNEQLLANKPDQRPNARQVLSVIDQQLHGGRRLLLAGAVVAVGLVAVLVAAKLWSAVVPKPVPVPVQVPVPVAAKPEVVPAKTVVSNLAKPVLVLESSSRFFSSLSSNAKWFVRQVGFREVELVDAKTQSPSGRLTIDEDILAMELNAGGNLLAIAGKENRLRMVSVPGLQEVYRSDIGKFMTKFMTKMLWAGKQSDILVFSQGGDVFAIPVEKQTGNHVKNPVKLEMIPEKYRNNVVVRDIVSHPDSDHLLAITNNQAVLVWSFEKNRMVQQSSQADKRKESRLGWRDSENYCIYQGRSIIETSILPDNTQKSLHPKMVDMWELPSVAEDVIWLNEKTLIYSSDLGEKAPQIHQAKRGGRSTVAGFDTTGESVYKLQALANPGQFAAYCKSGRVLIFQVALQ